MFIFIFITIIIIISVCYRSARGVFCMAPAKSPSADESTTETKTAAVHESGWRSCHLVVAVFHLYADHKSQDKTVDGIIMW